MGNHDNEKQMEIKQAARTLFFRLGFSKTSMDDIAALCHLAKPTLYYYYPNKESIFNEIVVEEARKFMDRIEKKLDTHLSPPKKLAAFFRQTYEDLEEYARETADLPDRLFAQNPHGTPIGREINRLFADKLRPILEEGKELSLLAIRDVDASLRALVEMTDFLNLNWMRREPKAARDAVVNEMIDIILNGLTRRD